MATTSLAHGLVPAPTDTRSLRQAYAAFPSGVVAVCAEVDGIAHGIAVSSFVPVSLDPPLVSFCVQNSSATWPILRRASSLGLSLLSAEQPDVARTLGTRTGNRFDGVTLRHGTHGALFIDGAGAWLETTVHATTPAGDHTIVILHTARITDPADTEPLVFHSSRFRRLRPNPDLE